MDNSYSLSDCMVKEFYSVLRELNGIAPIHGKIHDMLCDMQKDMSESAQKVLYIYFSLLEDGNTRLALDPVKAHEKWCIKWRGLIKLSNPDRIVLPVCIDDAESEFEQIFKAGIQDILTHHYSKIIEKRDSNIQTAPHCVSCPLVRAKDKRDSTEYLYATRYFDAKCVIESKAHEIFSLSSSPITDKQRASYQAYYKPLLNDKDRDFMLANRQLDAVIRGQTENLIITGGPGTGKTTVICFLLWKLLAEHEDMLDWDIKLAAPSGKAADRMRESLLGSLSKFKDSRSKIYQKLHDLESFTLHRLLSYNPGSNQFNYNAENPFPEKSIYIIDEASMIDIDLFSRFIQALPNKNYKLFILGDPDQLPSVEAGAVLGEMLKTGRNCTVRLNESQRFDITSNIGKLSIAIQNAKPHCDRAEDSEYSDIRLDNTVKPDFKPISGMKIEHCFPDIDTDTSDIIHHLSLSEDRRAAEHDLEKIIHAWVDHFYIKQDYIGLSHSIYIDSQTGQINHPELLNQLWKFTRIARILSAERKGQTGVTALNEMVRKALKVQDSGRFFVGQLLMLTENQSTLKLYNGDCGIVLGESNSGRLHLLLRKVRTQNSRESKSEGDTVNFVTYPLSLLPTEALESAFAMTIHKSQGSGYGNIMMFLPQTVGHPLLNNQMIYTGVTRTERLSLTIIANEEAFRSGCRTNVERDTGIDIS